MRRAPLALPPEPRLQPQARGALGLRAWRQRQAQRAGQASSQPAQISALQDR
jgi:hypothetical protein